MKTSSRLPFVVGIGELLWDLLPGDKQLGGAPANFAYHAHQLGARSAVISSVGDDGSGVELYQRLGRLGVETGTITIHPTLPTGSVTVELDSAGQPQYEIHAPVAWDEIQANPAAIQSVDRADAIVLGTLAQRSPVSRQAIQAVLQSAPAKTLRVFDINLRQRFYNREIIEQGMKSAHVLKLNDEELGVLGQLLGLHGGEREQVRQLMESYDLRWVALTRGARGSLICSQDETSEVPGQPVNLVDTVGAGDAFTACLTLGLLAGWDLDRINRRASQLAAFLCSCAGATPTLPSAMLTWFDRSVPVHPQVDAAVHPQIRPATV